MKISCSVFGHNWIAIGYSFDDDHTKTFYLYRCKKCNDLKEVTLDRIYQNFEE